VSGFLAGQLKNSPHGFHAVQLLPRFKFMQDNEQIKIIDGGENSNFMPRYRQIVGDSWNSTDSYFQLQIIPGLTCDIPYEAIEKFKRLNLYEEPNDYFKNFFRFIFSCNLTTQ